MLNSRSLTKMLRLISRICFEIHGNTRSLTEYTELGLSSNSWSLTENVFEMVNATQGEDFGISLYFEFRKEGS